MYDERSRATIQRCTQLWRLPFLASSGVLSRLGSLVFFSLKDEGRRDRASLRHDDRNKVGKQRIALGSGSFCDDAVPQCAQGIQRIVQNYVFFDVVRGGDKQFFHPGKDGFLRIRNPLWNLVPIRFKQRSTIKGVPVKAQGKT